MTTVTDICNRALGVLGHDRTITDYATDTSTEAVRCRCFYPAAFSKVLAAHSWDFASVEIELTLTWQDSRGYSRVERPADCLRLTEIVDGGGHPLPVRQVGNALYVKPSGGKAYLKYVSRETDIAACPEAFVEAVVYELAALLCGPMFGDAKKVEGYMQLAVQSLSSAISNETDETAFRGEWDNSFIKARE